MNTEMQRDEMTGVLKFALKCFSKNKEEGPC